jgi:hypothetical protein
MSENETYRQNMQAFPPGSLYLRPCATVYSNIFRLPGNRKDARATGFQQCDPTPFEFALHPDASVLELEEIGGKPVSNE